MKWVLLSSQFIEEIEAQNVNLPKVSISQDLNPEFLTPGPMLQSYVSP